MLPVFTPIFQSVTLETHAPGLRIYGFTKHDHMVEGKSHCDITFAFANTR